VRPRWDRTTSPWRTAEECAEYLAFYCGGEPDRSEARRYLDARSVPKVHRGRVVLYDRAAVEATLTPARRTA
jgi:hypothetical protein